MHRKTILDTAIKYTCGERDDSYGPPSVNLACHAELIEVYKKYSGDKFCGGHDAAMFQVLCKIARIACGKFKDDNYIDASAYLAIAYECEQTHKDTNTKIGGPEIQEALLKNLRHPKSEATISIQNPARLTHNNTPSVPTAGMPPVTDWVKMEATSVRRKNTESCDCDTCDCNTGVE